ncbi:NUDIX domain-containing protein [Solwaraspora sp. WMMD1047]|uniref:NUDIX hydrolase n=1 Tax=Solwaraspora sp. WMMD1047 TaxID=3016102 RepID=UPI0024172A0D|nr:NUDIX domain-containing protein [Solwaraspora sp. WMMD1047]MDG4834608.1 NUDIX domain-containing protein [Solwaraspora sp. WMMD1047]
MEEYPPFAVTVDLVVLTVREEELKILLVRRGVPPYEGRWALPGGFVRIDEDLPAAAARELAEETGIREPAPHLEQLGTYGEPRRDPRQRVVTVAYLALLPNLSIPEAGSDAAEAQWRSVTRVAADRLAFDHHKIVTDGVDRARSKLEYTSLATAFCPPEFTIAQLREVYEIVWGRELDARNFHRKVTGTVDFVEWTGRSTEGGPGRPARLFRAGGAAVLHPPMLRQRADN